MSFWKSKKQSKCPFNISYHYHKPESGKLILYNLSGKTVRNVHLTIIGEQNQKLPFDIPELQHKTTHLVDYSMQPDGQQPGLEGPVRHVEVACSGKKYVFRPDESWKFSLV